MEKVCIIGLGYVGYPLAKLCADKGLDVVGLDLKKELVEKINNHNEFFATTNFKDIKDCNIYIICVPTPIDEKKEPDLTPLISASKTVSKYLKENDLVVVESTVFPGTCDEVVLPILKESQKNFYLAYCPERINPGDSFWTTENIPRVIGALSKAGLDISAKFYQKILGGEIFEIDEIKDLLRPKVIKQENGYKLNSMPLNSITKMKTIREAESVKVMENTVRDVNIAFINELAKICNVLDLDIVNIINGMTTKPFGKGPYYPGIGVGGHCIAVDPEWLKTTSIKAGFLPEIIQLSRNTNNKMPKFAINLLKKFVPINKTKIAVLGVAYKGNIEDARESPFFEIKKLLEEENAAFEVFDPYCKNDSTINDLNEILDLCDSIILITDHHEFRKLTPQLLNEKGIKYIIDGRNCLDQNGIKNIGIKYKGIGR
jgi:UDP-N-acetyl-D-glucosamine dehydrogenase